MVSLDNHAKQNNEMIFQESLIQWFNLHKRDYPWRKQRNIYRVLVSEIFLQRTKADQVEPIYNAFIHKYPEFKFLKEAEKDEITAVFRSLGLHKRGSFFFEMIQSIKYVGKDIEDFTETELYSLKGMGRYSVNAILCFGRNERRALIDANIIRIFHRVFNYFSDKQVPRNDKRLWNFAQKILPKVDYVDYNYALIDFGALICKPKNPLCSSCVLRDICHYYNHFVSITKDF